MDRRQFVYGTLTVAGLAAISGSEWFAEPLRAAVLSSPQYVSVNGLLNVSLSAVQSWVTLAGRRAYLYNYNGWVPGPVLVVNPGDTVQLRLNNNLGEDTNLHYHGLHVSPTGTADNIFLDIPAGQFFMYSFGIPGQHAPGLFWYHPHCHGLVAKQVSMGLAAPIIVRGAIDRIPEIAAAREEILVLQDWDLDASGYVIQPSPMERMQGREGALITVSGLLQPALSIQQDGLLRLRVLNACASRYFLLSMQSHPMYLIATDGGPLPAPVAYDKILLLPGQRIDVLVKGTQGTGSYALQALPYNRGGMMGGMMGAMMGGMMGGSTTTQTLATIKYQGRSAQIRNIPSHVGSVSPLPSPNVRRTFTISQGMMMSFLINGRTFDPNRIDTAVTLGAVEEWEFINQTGMDHPMHLHVNPFQVIGPNGQPELAWRDVVNVPARGSVRFRIQFADFAGKTVQHCHILDHEDMGMMATVDAS
jgi:FtsP/CotA-like multicopper oxidase with cupredoxin domain